MITKCSNLQSFHERNKGKMLILVRKWTMPNLWRRNCKKCKTYERFYTDLKLPKLELPSKLSSCRYYCIRKLLRQILQIPSMKKLPFCVLMQWSCAMFHCIHATINSLQNLENTTEVPVTDLMGKKHFNCKISKPQKLDHIDCEYYKKKTNTSTWV